MSEESLEELESAVLNTIKKLEVVSQDSIIAENINVSDIATLLARCRDFIDFAKFEFGETITQ